MELVTSFAVRDGRAIRPDLHWRRLGLNPRIWVPEVGNYFPQVRVYRSTAHYRLRPQPPLRTGTALWLAQDPRNLPHLKGPDFTAQLKLRAQALSHGADDAALVADGFIREAANASLIFFRGDELIQAPESLVVDSVTVRAAVEAGLIPAPRRERVPVGERLPAVAVSALHGFTPVTSWTDSQKPAPEPPLDCESINVQLWARAKRLDGPLP
ncbi:hypothetical protein CPHO_08100 [Corynebacterium phocae]|uniref:Aminotransferase n=1 Tax=Corynebacterium phocae TaxID=161895 RepID=A0A1L7D452_9CORY|nr:aminotransferase class IV [Corynebacterium phocae]APT92853.1 hypothetical protein CPHO_08100 [Corynebacterium phocae]KAA8723173.1 aminotransferase class IV [Corynebacterium phocae]